MRILYLYFMAAILIISCSKTEEERCGTAPIIDSELYDNTPTTHYHIRDAHINRGCLNVSLAASGCDGRSWEVRLIEDEEKNESQAAVKSLKIEFISFEDCEAYIFKNFQFNLSMGDYEEDSTIHLEGWDGELIYKK